MQKHHCGRRGPGFTQKLTLSEAEVFHITVGCQKCSCWTRPLEILTCLVHVWPEAKGFFEVLQVPPMCIQGCDFLPGGLWCSRKRPGMSKISSFLLVR